eukprot:c28687_g1_i1.p1 GENE.c28687_g1_i1~~c28687_g1_i1.p1  ORF type:complete len:430 (-),score=83.79 c28687_g1_i1:7-1296(-)
MELPLKNDLIFVAFFAAVWASELVCSSLLRVSPLLGQVVVGLLLGPAEADIVPFTEALVLLGRLGLYCMVIESALGIDIAEARAVFGRSVLAAVLGLVGPIAFAFLVMSGIYSRNWQAALSVGAAIAPTSFGFSAKLFMEVGQIDTPLARIACSAAVIDDMLSLVLLSVVAIQNQHSEASVWQYAAPIAGCFGSITFGCLLCHFASEPLARLEHRIPPPMRTRVLLTLVLATGVAASLSCRLVKTSELLGCYFTGLLFSSSNGVREVWKSQMKRLTRWGSALFFSATIAFSVPSLNVLFSRDAASRGILLLLAAMLGKSFVGFFTKPLTPGNVLKFAAAMNARGEFNFQVTALAFQQGVITDQDAAGLTWALLFLTLVTPLWFRLTFRSRAHPGSSVGNAQDSSDSQYASVVATEAVNVELEPLGAVVA